MLRKKTNGVARRPQRTSILSEVAEKSVDRRAFLRGSGLAIGGLAAIGATGGTVTRATAQTAATEAVDLVKSVCTHCSVGCTVVAEVSNGVWVGQEPGWDSPFNLGAHCAKGASVREHAHGERRLKYPMKKEGGEWKAHQLGTGDRRDRRRHDEHPRGKRPGFSLLAGLSQA